MAAKDDIAIADAYAEALLELSEERGNSDAILTELGEVAGLIEKDAVLADFLASPAVDEQEREAELEKIFRGRMNDLLLDTLQVVNAKDRASIIPAIYERYRLALQRARGDVDVRVTTAVPLTRKLLDRLRETLKRRTGRKPLINEEVDASLLGGLVVQIGDEKLDCSISSRLRRLRQAMRGRASREIHAGKDYFEAVEG
ncbi:MAG TPA: ATP synthase F1 subunit delta [Phycisphaerae bacterium]|nr:ATP synthase F1 subunit delta [Phycisphaerae bacterium]